LRGYELDASDANRVGTPDRLGASIDYCFADGPAQYRSRELIVIPGRLTANWILRNSEIAAGRSETYPMLYWLRRSSSICL